MTDNYLQYEEAYSSSRKTVPSQQDVEKRKEVISETQQNTGTKSSGDSVVYTHKKSSYSQVRYVHKQDKNSVQTD